MGIESHYSSKKDRVFVEGSPPLQTQDELARLRALPRCRKGSEIKFVDGPQAYSRHYVEPHERAYADPARRVCRTPLIPWPCF